MHAGVLRLPRLIRTAPDLGSDAELLRRFTATRDEPAFAELVRRHGPLVLAVCRRVVSDSHLADDAFQATFVVLARKAASAGVGCRLSTWLHSVAVKVSLRARTMVGRRAKRETLTAAVPERGAVPPSVDDTAAALDEEIDRLPESLRVAVVLCELRGVSRRDAAKELGIAEGTLSSRLATARKKLAERLRARGLAPAAGFFFAACVPTDLATAAVAASTGRVELSSQLTQLVDGGMKMALLTKLKLAAVAVVVAVLSAGGFGVGPFANADAAPRTNAPVPKSAYPDGLIWVLNDITFEMVAFTPDGEKAKEFKLKDGPRVLGVTPDGKKLAFAGKNGKSADPKETDGLTVHLRDIGPELDGTDTGMKYEQRNDLLLWSPDARQVVRHRPHQALEVVAGADPNYTLYDLDTKKEKNLALPGGHRFFGWSPDGKWLLVGSHERAALQWSRWYKYTPADGKLHAITEAHSAYRMDVTADGKSIIGYANSKVVKDLEARGAENWRVVRIDVVSGEETVLTKFARPEGYAYGWIRSAPRGDRFLFWAGVERKGEGTQDMRLSVHDADGTEAKLVKRFDYNPWDVLGWFPDPKADPRRKNAPIPKDGGDPGVVWSYNPQTGNLIACRPNGDTLKEWKLPYGNWFKGVTPDGTRFLYGAEKRNVLPDPIFDPAPTLRLHTRPIDDEKAFTDLGTPVGYFNEIVWSPDAKQFFRVHFTLDKPRDLTVTVHDADGKERHKWTTTDKHPVGWTGDGTGLILDAALDDGPKGKAKFVKSDLKGEKIEPLFAGVYFDSVRVSPDGTRLLGFDNLAPYLGDSDKPNKRVLVYDVATKKTATVAQREKQTHADGLWSPDGKRIAYRWCEFQPKPLGGGGFVINGQYHFATCDADGKNETELFVEPRESATMIVAWTPTPPALKNAKPQPRRNAPVPKVREGGRLWLHDQQANELVAYSPALTEVERIKLPKGERFRGLTPDGASIVYADKPDGGTYHLRPLDGDGKAVDLGLDASAKDQPPYWNRSGTKFVRSRILATEGVQATPLQFDVFDVNTRKVTPPDKGFEGHWMLGWTEDDHLLSRCMVGPQMGTIYRTSLDGKQTVVLKDDKFHPHRLDVSRDGAVIVGAFRSTAPKTPWHHALVSMDPKTGAVTELFHQDEQGATEPAWSPDGGRIGFAWGYQKDGTDPNGWDELRLSVADADGKNRKTATLREKRRGQEPTTLSFLGWYPEPRRNAPVPKQVGWKEATPITFADGGRVTSVAYSPSGKTLAVARDGGRIDFFDPITRKHIVSMNAGGEKGATAATVTAVAFCPVPHPKNGDIFAVTHKHGVKFGTVGLGIFTDDAAKVDGVPVNWTVKDFDPHQLKWLGDKSLVATNGAKLEWRFRLDGKPDRLDFGWELPNGKRHGPTVLEAVPGFDDYPLTNGSLFQEKNEIEIAVAPPASSPQARLAGHQSRPAFAAVAKDGKRMVSADEGGTVIVWDTKQELDFKEKARTSIGPGLAQMALSPDGKTVAVLRVYGVTWTGAAANRSSEVFDLFVFDATDPPAKPTPIWSNETRDFPGQRNGPASLAFGPDGKTLLAAFADPFTEDKQKYGDIPKSVGVKVWTLAEPNEPKRNAPVPKGKPNALAYFPHEVGTRWVYERVRPAAGEKPVKLLTIREVTGVVPGDDGGVRVTIQQSYDSDPPMDKAKNVTHEVVYRITADGVDCLSFGGHKFTLPRRELASNMASGDEWPLFPTRKDGEPATVRVGKEEAVTVPAGRYTALPLRWVGDGVPKTDKDQEYIEGMGIVPRTGSAQYYAKDVGLVKCDAYELREFTPGKPADPKKDGPKLEGKIAVWQGDSVAVLSPDGKELSRHTREELGEEFGSAFVRLSPDGRRVALAWCENHNRNSGHAAIFSADGKKVEHATGFIGAPWAAYWLADKDDSQFGINGSLKMHFLSQKSGEMMDAIGNGYNAILAAAPNGVVVQQHGPKTKTLRVGTQEADDDDCYFVAEKDLGGTVVGVSRDGRTLLVVGAKGVILHDAKTGDRVTVAERADGCGAALASNGEAVVYVTRTEPKERGRQQATFTLSVYDRATKEATVLIRDSKTPIRAVDWWSPAKADDRKKNAPVPKEKDAGLLWVKDEKANQLTAYTPALEVAKRVKLPAAAKFIGLTPDGTGMVCANDSIYVRRAEQTPTYHIFPLGEDTLGTDLELDHTVWDFPPIWSPDGKKFLRVRKDVKRKMPGFLGTIFRYDVFDLATKKATHLADVPFDHWILDWAADGKKFITQSLRKGEEDTLHLMDPDGTSKPLPAEEKALRPYKLARSPDGKTFLFSSYDTLWRIDAATGKRTELLDKTHGFPKPAWSPDGKRMAVAYCQFTKSKSPQPWDVQRLVVSDADGTNRKEITLRDKEKGEEAYDVDFLGWYPNPKPAPAVVVPPKKNAPVPKEEPKAVEAWGEAKGGLQAGLRMPRGATVSPDAAGEVQLVVRNVGKEAKEVTFWKRVGPAKLIEGRLDWVEGNGGKYDLRFYTILSGRPPEETAVRINPGEEVVLWRTGVCNGQVVALPEGLDARHAFPVGTHKLTATATGAKAGAEVLATGELEVSLPELKVTAPVPKEKEETMGLTASVTFDKKEILLGEPTYFTFQVQNPTDKGWQFEEGGDYRNRLGRPESFAVTVTGPDGKPVPQPDAGPSLGGIAVMVKLPADGKAAFRPLFLPHWATFEKPGEYTVTVKRQVGLVPGDAEDGFRAKATPVNLSATVKITVLPLDKKKLGELIETLGAAMLDHKTDGYDKAIKKMQAIRDPRVIPFFIELGKLPHPSDRYAACEGLSHYKTDEAFAALKKLYATTGLELRESATTQELANSSADGVRHAAIGAILQCGHPEALPFAWKTGIEDGYYGVRLTILHKAYDVKTPEARKVIAKLLDDMDESIRREAKRYTDLLANEKK